MRGLIAFLLAVFVSAAFANAAEIKTMTVSYPSGHDTVSAYLAVPAAAGRHPALIVIHEWWGLRDWIRRNARELARHGYVALAIDLYRGRVTDNPQEAYKLMTSVPHARAVADLKAAFHYLSGLGYVEASRIGVIGWCMGGSYSYIAALNLPKLAACVIDYGKVGTTGPEVEPIRCPVLCNFAGLDRTYTVEMGKAFAAAMKAEGKTVEFHEYPGVNHAFMNPNNPGIYNASAAKLAWERIYAFLGKYLR